MTTALDDTIVIEPSGLLKVCAWCVSRERLHALAQTYTVSHTLCTECAVRLSAGGSQ